VKDGWISVFSLAVVGPALPLVEKKS